jgi:hypothetical protein
MAVEEDGAFRMEVRGAMDGSSEVLAFIAGAISVLAGSY